MYLFLLKPSNKALQTFFISVSLTQQQKLNTKKEPQPASCDPNIFLLTIVYHSQLFFKSVEAKLRTLIDGN